MRGNWLGHHMQRRVVKGSISVVKGSISSGVPLGWIEGPMLFSNSMVIEMMEAGYGLFLLYWRSGCFHCLLSVLTGEESIFSSLYLFV